jgi:glycosyltransferase involved in cell wall biosynthesis
MRILNVTRTVHPVRGGGTAERVLHMSRAQAALGHEPVVLTTDAGVSAKRRSDFVPVRLVPVQRLVPRYFIPRPAFRTVRELVAGADVIHLLGHWSVLNVVVHRYARRAGRPYVISPAGELPVVGRSRFLKQIFNSVAGRQIVRDAAGHIAIATSEVPHFAPYGVPAERVQLVPNGVVPASAQVPGERALREKLRIGDSPYLLFVGRLNWIKGPDLLLDAFVRLAPLHPALRLVLAGPDEGMLEALRTQAAAASLADSVVFTGHLAGEWKEAAYRYAELLVIPSRQEAMSIVVLEAAAQGTPVLLTAACGFDDVERVAGGMVVDATAEALHDGLRRLLAVPVSLPAMGARLREHVLANFSWERVAADLVDYYRALLVT